MAKTATLTKPELYRVQWIMPGNRSTSYWITPGKMGGYVRGHVASKSKWSRTDATWLKSEGTALGFMAVLHPIK
jgi:hypothetical protein